jgi:exodeoxyribonuclease V alpha subunit
MAAPPARVARLDTIFRQGETSGIIRTAHAIRAGETHPDKTLQSLRELNHEDDFVFIEADSPEQTAKAIRYLATEYIPKTHRLDPIRELANPLPMHRGSSGISALNPELQEALNPESKALSRLKSDPDYAPARQSHFERRPANPFPRPSNTAASPTASATKSSRTVITTTKTSSTATPVSCSASPPTNPGLTINFNGEQIEYTKGELGEIQLAYAISIHKSQGSEYPAVIIPLLKQHFMMLQRNLVYTGITRARQKVYLVGDLEAYAMAVRNNKTEIRRTHLQARLRNAGDSDTEN